MTRRMTVQVDTDAISAATAVREAATAAPGLLVLTGRMMADLAGQLGSMDAGVRFLVDLAGEIDRPLGVNVETGSGTSSTVLISPRSLSPERLQGWVAAKHEQLAEQFGEIAGVRPEGGRG